jgi:hypothetical protein
MRLAAAWDRGRLAEITRMLEGFEPGRVSAARLLSPQVRNVTIAAESLAGFVFEPGADVAIRLHVATAVPLLCVEEYGGGQVRCVCGVRWAGAGESVGCAVCGGGPGRDLLLPRPSNRT